MEPPRSVLEDYVMAQPLKATYGGLGCLVSVSFVEVVRTEVLVGPAVRQRGIRVNIAACAKEVPLRLRLHHCHRISIAVTIEEPSRRRLGDAL